MAEMMVNDFNVIFPRDH